MISLTFQRRTWSLAALLFAKSVITLLWAQEPLSVSDVKALPARIAFGSCAQQEKPHPILYEVLEKQPDLFVYLGDNIYGDTEDMAILRRKYERLGAKREFQLLRSQVPTLAIWDDHDYGVNDGGKEYPQKEASKGVFLDFWLEPDDSVRRRRPGIYHHHRFSANGRSLQVILLDTRSFRDPLARNRLNSWKNAYHPDPDPEKTLLGDAQWKWLDQVLREPADVRIIATSIQFAHEYNGWESWTNLPSELYKMLRTIREAKANGVVFISGDVHWGEVSVLPVEDLYPIHDVTSSGLTEDWEVVEPNRNRHGPAVQENNFGFIEVEWEAEDPVLSLSIIDLEGTSRVTKRVPLSTLQVAEE